MKLLEEAQKMYMKILHTQIVLYLALFHNYPAHNDYLTLHLPPRIFLPKLQQLLPNTKHSYNF